MKIISLDVLRVLDFNFVSSWSLGGRGVDLEASPDAGRTGVLASRVRRPGKAHRDSPDHCLVY